MPLEKEELIKFEEPESVELGSSKLYILTRMHPRTGATVYCGATYDELIKDEWLEPVDEDNNLIRDGGCYDVQEVDVLDTDSNTRQELNELRVKYL